MIKWLLAVVGGLAAWHYRGPIKEYVNQRLPELQKKATTVLGDTAEKLNTAGRSSAGQHEGRF